MLRNSASWACQCCSALFLAFFGRLKSIAERAPDHFSRLLVIGILAWLSVQACINIGAMIGLLPLKGITLPLISSGGTSVIFVAAAIGLAFQVSYYTSFAPPRMRQLTEGTHMTIVVTGGGSGGHITPILAVARELKKLRPDADRLRQPDWRSVG
jgi:hypothetical protein